MRINESYQKMFPNNCPVIEVTGDGVEVGTCTYYMPDGICPRHGRLLTKRGADSLQEEPLRDDEFSSWDDDPGYW